MSHAETQTMFHHSDATGFELTQCALEYRLNRARKESDASLRARIVAARAVPANVGTMRTIGDVADALRERLVVAWQAQFAATSRWSSAEDLT